MHLTDSLKRQAPQEVASNDEAYRWTIVLGRGPLDDAASMTASEQMFFLGAPLSHVVLHEEMLTSAWAERKRPR